jgi:hypothetical protein
VRAALLLALAPLLSLTGCGTDAALEAIAGDPMATATFVNTKLVDEAKRSGGTSLGKPVQAKITRQFSYEGVTPEDLVSRVADQAIEDGWESAYSKATSFIATKDIDGVAAGLTVSIADYDGVPTMFIYLTASD